jgi:hypothetical protein
MAYVIDYELLEKLEEKIGKKSESLVQQKSLSLKMSL